MAEATPRNAGGPKRLELLERVSKIFAVLAIPVILAVIGYYFDARIQERAAAQECVALAIEILSEEDPDQNLHSWAVKIVNEYSPVDLPRSVMENKMRLPAPDRIRHRSFARDPGFTPEEFRRLRELIQ